ncbi:MAG TPA: inositol monophosphatase family protein [Fimbriimonadaceae bacterium]|nr:inositol monophosphatase family protein [Fimbriimonadaceae bacterium]
MPSPSHVLAELERMVREAGKIAQMARKNLVRELKPDGSVVTNGDREVETFLRDALKPLVPGASFWGEEFGKEPNAEAGVWAIDPVDGTTNYSFGSPIWGVTVGLIQSGNIEYGAVSLPDLDEHYCAQRLHGALCNGEPIAQIPAGPILNHEIVGYCDTLMRRFPGRRWPGKMRCSGAFVVEAMFTVRQRYRGMIGIREKLYDVAGSVCIALESGAEVRYANGSPFQIEPLMADVPIADPWVIFPAEAKTGLEESSKTPL